MSGARLSVIRWMIALVDLIILCALKSRMMLGRAAARQKRRLERTNMVDAEQEARVFHRVWAISERLRLDISFSRCLFDEIIAETLRDQQK